MAKEYTCTCGNCGHVWGYNDADLRDIRKLQSQIKRRMAVGITGALRGSTVNPAWQTQRIQQISQQYENPNRCRNCGSVGVSVTAREVYNYFLDDPSSPLYSPAAIGAKDASSSSKSKYIAAVLAILLGGLGIHKFYLGYAKEGVIMLALFFVGAFISFGVVPALLVVFGWIEGIVYLAKDKDDFYTTYVLGHKSWL